MFVAHAMGECNVVTKNLTPKEQSRKGWEW